MPWLQTGLHIGHNHNPDVLGYVPLFCDLQECSDNWRQLDKVDKSARFTRAQRKTSESTYSRSALTDHSSQNNHIIDWDNSKLVGREDQWKRRQILETIRIQQEGDSALNRDGGNYDLPRLWTPLLLTDASIKPAKCNMHKAVSHNRKSSLW